ncbi:methyltransferase domain-containing protein [Halarcobacter sp.]|uniref:methyltransferase domain-containing protein n=1 Tax=Halarcobacter sp. TaxID=2321133 RepID=UPI003A9231E7
MSFIDQHEIEKNYNKIDDIWTEDDPWHYYTLKKIQNFIKKETKKINFNYNFRVLNAGSAGNEYGIKCKEHIHVDIIEKDIINKPYYIVGSIEKLPLKKNEINFILCVGSVINYTDAMLSIREFNRLTEKNGYLILEFENSYSYEYFLTDSFKKTANIVTTFYKGEEEKVWVYSHKYIKKLLESNNFKILKSNNFHILSPLIYKITKNDKFASKFSFFDKVLAKIPIIKNYSSNVILLCQKI